MQGEGRDNNSIEMWVYSTHVRIVVFYGREFSFLEDESVSMEGYLLIVVDAIFGFCSIRFLKYRKHSRENE